jgi:biotin carboxyl carrier protein
MFIPSHQAILCVIGAAVFGIAGCSSVHNAVVIRAPIDGHVIRVVDTGHKAKGTISEAQRQFDVLRTAVGIPQRYSTPELNQDDPTSVVVELTSDVLELQVKQETIKLALANERLDLARKTYGLENELKDVDMAREDAKAIYQKELTYEGYLRMGNPRDKCELPNQACTGQPRAAKFIKAGNTMSDKTVEGFAARQDYQLTTELPNRLDLARKELESAATSVAIINANIALGRITCPRACTVRKVFVMPGQYVTKGDPLLAVAVQLEPK